MQESHIMALRSQATWKLFALSIVTLGVYSAHYIKAQTVKIDKLPHGISDIGVSYTKLLLGLTYISLATLILSLLFPENTALRLSDNVLNLSTSIMTIIWGFKASNRINLIFNFNKSCEHWFNAAGTFFLSPFYFNYKVNCISDIYSTKQPENSEA